MENQSETPTKMTIQKHTLQDKYHIFGNKGNVWSNECHIAKSDLSGRTLCDTPMLSSNWARIENVQEIGCQECIELYLAATKK
jgi:hypothetical protein